MRSRVALHLELMALRHPLTTMKRKHQITEAFPWDTSPHAMIRDRDRVYGAGVGARVKVMGIEEVVTAPRPPWQNRFVERAIGPLSGAGLEWRLSPRASRPAQRPDGEFRNDRQATRWPDARGRSGVGVSPEALSGAKGDRHDHVVCLLFKRAMATGDGCRVRRGVVQPKACQATVHVTTPEIRLSPVTP